MNDRTYFNNQFLIAMPAMEDPNFAGTVTYMCEHTDEGALGIIINRPLPLTLADLFEQMDIEVSETAKIDIPVMYGGPLHPERGFVIHKTKGKWNSSFETSSELSVTTSRDILEAIAQENGPDEILVSLGYSGWGVNQLEVEMTSNSWLHCEADSDILFNTPLNERWDNAVKKLGIDPRSLSGIAGHA